MRETQTHTALTTYRNSTNARGNGKKSLSTRELVQNMYGSVPDEAYSQAIEPSITEVLWKLAEDRKVGFESLGGCRRWFVNAPLQSAV